MRGLRRASFVRIRNAQPPCNRILHPKLCCTARLEALCGQLTNMASQMAKAPSARPFTASVSAPSTRRACVAAPARRVAEARPMRVRAAEPEAAPQTEVVEVVEEEDRSFRRAQQDQPQFKHFLPLPKPAHLVYIKPTVAVVAGSASRSSVGLKMTAGDNQLERYVIEFYSKSVK